MNQEKKVGAGIGIILFRNERVLLGKRHGDAKKAGSELRGEGTWTLPGGKLEWGETFEEGVAREVMEETGITLGSCEVITVSNDKNDHAHFVTIGCYSEDFEGEAEVREPNKITEWQWWSLDELPEPLFFPSARVLEMYKKGVVYQPYD